MSWMNCDLQRGTMMTRPIPFSKFAAYGSSAGAADRAGSSEGRRLLAVTWPETAEYVHSAPRAAIRDNRHNDLGRPTTKRASDARIGGMLLFSAAPGRLRPFPS